MKEWDGLEKRANYDQRLITIETTLSTLSVDIKEMLKKHEQELYGNGKEGLKIKVDRLEIHKKNTDIHSIAGYTAFVGLIGKLVYDWIQKPR